MNNPHNPIDTSLKVGGNTPVQSNNILHATTHKTLDFGDIGVTEYIPNPAYVKIAKEHQACLENIQTLEKKHQELNTEVKKLSGVNAKIIGAIIGSLTTVGLTFLFIYTKAKQGDRNQSSIWYLLLIPAGILGIIVGGALSVAAYFGSDKAKKIVASREKKLEILELDQEILVLKAKEKDVWIECNAVQKQIAKYAKIARDEDDIEFQNFTNQKAIPLESLKSKKFKTLDFSGKWKDLIGTPETNFCLMVYGKPGQDKSYFTLELSEYLASNFGTVLFNSSEEAGRSLTF